MNPSSTLAGSAAQNAVVAVSVNGELVARLPLSSTFLSSEVYAHIVGSWSAVEEQRLLSGESLQAWMILRVAALHNDDPLKLRQCWRALTSFTKDDVREALADQMLVENLLRAAWLVSSMPQKSVRGATNSGWISPSSSPPDDTSVDVPSILNILLAARVPPAPKSARSTAALLRTSATVESKQAPKNAGTSAHRRAEYDRVLRLRSKARKKRRLDSKKRAPFAASNRRNTYIGQTRGRPSRYMEITEENVSRLSVAGDVTKVLVGVAKGQVAPPTSSSSPGPAMSLAQLEEMQKKIEAAHGELLLGMPKSIVDDEEENNGETMNKCDARPPFVASNRRNTLIGKNRHAAISTKLLSSMVG